jgi:hypothetical protein
MRNNIVERAQDPCEIMTITMDELRKTYLKPELILEAIRSNDCTLLNNPVGSGKSFLIDRLLEMPELYSVFDRVVCTANRWEILNERTFVENSASAPSGVEVVVVYPRPITKCVEAGLNDRWKVYEDSHCYSLGRGALCTTCPNNTVSSPCPWPRSIAQKVGDAQLIFLPDQHFDANPQVLRFMGGSGVRKTLLIADEGIFLTTPKVVEISAWDLQTYADLVSHVAQIPKELKERTKEVAKTVRTANKKILASAEVEFPSGLLKYQTAIQVLGHQRYGATYRDISYALQALGFSRQHERWKTTKGSIRYLFRPYLKDCTLLVCSGQLNAKILKMKTKFEKVHAPLANLRVKLPEGTKVFNIKNSTGRLTHYLDWTTNDGVLVPGNCHYVLAFFLRKIIWNLENGLTTVLVSKKGKPLEFAAEWLQEKLLDAGYSVTFVTGPYDKALIDPRPHVIPIITYGTYGVNLFSSYDCCYCINSYNINEGILVGNFFDGLPEESLPEIQIRKDSTGSRTVLPNPALLGGLWEAINEMLQMMEKGVALQAVGRVRPYNYPREIILYANHSFANEFGTSYTEFATLEEAYQYFDLDNIKRCRRRVKFNRYLECLAKGSTKEEARLVAGISKPTVSRYFRDFSDHKSS